MEPGIHLGEFEELVLLAVQALGEEAYTVSVRDALEHAGRKAAPGALYVTLDRLEEKGLVSSRLADPTPERGGRRKRFYRIEGNGIVALRQAELGRQALRGLKPAGGLT